MVRLINQINKFKGDFKIKGLILNDASAYSRIEFDNFEYRQFLHNHGRRYYYRIMNIAFDEMRKKDFKYFINLQDDVILTDDFFNKCIKTWESIKDKDKTILDLRTDERVGKSMWGIFPVNTVNTDAGKFYKSQWFDLVFMSDASIKVKMPVLDYYNIDTSSGVARQLTKRFRIKGFNMYHFEKSLVHHGHCESLMNPETRKKQKLIC